MSQTTQEIENKVIQEIEQVLSDSTITVTPVSLLKEDLGLDSVKLLMVIMALNESFDIDMFNMDEHLASNIQTIGNVIAAVESLANEKID